jgi:hypothetical protein
MTEGNGLTRLYKDGEYKDFKADEVIAAEQEGWKDSPQSLEDSAAPEIPGSGTEGLPTNETSEVKELK